MFGDDAVCDTAEHGGNKRLLMQTRQAITYLASDKAPFVTGPILGVNGGKTAS
jgi:hypothetical protein